MSVVKAFRRSIERSGLGGTLRLIPRWLKHRVEARVENASIMRVEAKDAFDATYGTETSKIVELYELDSVDEARIDRFARYRAVRASTVRACILALGIDCSDFVYVDVGCGKGRPLLVASLFPFARIVGVEFAAELCRVAEANIRAFAPPEQRCRDVSVVCADAREVELPAGNLVLFFYEPFVPEILQGVLDNARGSRAAKPRRMIFVSVRGGGTRPSLDPTFEQTPWLSRLADIPFDDTTAPEPSVRSALAFEARDIRTSF